MTFKPNFRPEARLEIAGIVGADEYELSATIRLIERDLEILLLAEQEERAAGQRKREARRFFVTVLAGRLEQYGISASAARGDSGEAPFMRIAKLAFEAAGIPNEDPYQIVTDAVRRNRTPPERVIELLSEAEQGIVKPALDKERGRKREIATNNRIRRRNALKT